MIDLFEPFRSTTGWWTIAVGATTNVACALVGCYLVLRRMSLMGDALAHAVLPGLVLAFLFSGTLNIVPLFFGAVTVGLLATFLIQSLHQYGRVPADASMGVVFTSMFALGVILVKRYLSGIHFDAACVYEGLLQFVALNTVDVVGLEVPRDTSHDWPRTVDEYPRDRFILERAENLLVRCQSVQCNGVFGNDHALFVDGPRGGHDRGIL